MSNVSTLHFFSYFVLLCCYLHVAALRKPSIAVAIDTHTQTTTNYTQIRILITVCNINIYLGPRIASGTSAWQISLVAICPWRQLKCIINIIIIYLTLICTNLQIKRLSLRAKENLIKFTCRWRITPYERSGRSATYPHKTLFLGKIHAQKESNNTFMMIGQTNKCSTNIFLFKYFSRLRNRTRDLCVSDHHGNRSAKRQFNKI